MRVYFVGGSGVGKSTLARRAAERTRLPLVDSSVRTTLREMGIQDFSDIFRNMELADAFQRAVWRQQLALEAKEMAAAGGFVADRAFEVAAYTADHSTAAKSIISTLEWERYIQALVADGSIVFFVRPEREIVERSADGTRDNFIGWECVNRIDGVVQFVLESHGIDYIPVRGTSLRDRYRLVDSVLKIAGFANGRKVEDA